MGERMRIEPADTRVQIVVDGVTIADSARPQVLLEQGHAPRYYLPREDVRLTALEPSETTTRCPFKGDANYYSVRVGETVHADVAWVYETPLPAAKPITGMLAFYTEKLDCLLDGEPQRR